MFFSVHPKENPITKINLNMSITASNSLTISEIKKIINYTIDNNEKLAKLGKKRIALNIVGEKGIGKTSLMEQIAKERGMTFTKLNVAQLDEVGDLIGLPVKEFEAQLFKPKKNEDGTVSRVPLKIVWGTEQVFKSMNPKSYQFTGKTRTGYAKPAWVPSYNEKGNFVVLDDYSRATPIFLNAMMDLIKDQEYVSWKFPDKTIICLTTNPDNGLYNVSASDPAQQRRYLTFNMEFNLDDWSSWAEKVGIDGRAINFAMSYGDKLFSVDEEGNSIADPRSFEMFSNMISGIWDWESSEGMAFIYNIAKGCFHDSDNRFGDMFAMFIRNRMHLLIQPKQMLLGSWTTVKEKMCDAIYTSDGEVRPAVATILGRRFANYVNAWLDSDEQTPIKTVKDRLLEFIRSDKQFFTEDIYYHMIQTITKEHKAQTNKLLFEPEIAAKIN